MIFSKGHYIYICSQYGSEQRTAKEGDAARPSGWTLAVKPFSTHPDHFREILRRPSRCEVDQYHISWQATCSICFELVDLDRRIKGMDSRKSHDDAEEYSGLIAASKEWIQHKRELAMSVTSKAAKVVG